MFPFTLPLEPGKLRTITVLCSVALAVLVVLPQG